MDPIHGDEAIPQLAEDPGLTRYEEAKKCPKCGKPGEIRKSYPAPQSSGLKPGTEIRLCYCTTEKPFECPWYNTSWTIQVNPDGTVPPPRDHTFSPKEYVADPEADDIIRRIEESLTMQKVIETERGGHGEIRS